MCKWKSRQRRDLFKTSILRWSVSLELLASCFKCNLHKLYISRAHFTSCLDWLAYIIDPWIIHWHGSINYCPWGRYCPLLAFSLLVRLWSTVKHTAIFSFMPCAHRFVLLFCSFNSFIHMFAKHQCSAYAPERNAIPILLPIGVFVGDCIHFGLFVSTCFQRNKDWQLDRSVWT